MNARTVQKQVSASLTAITLLLGTTTSTPASQASIFGAATSLPASALTEHIVPCADKEPVSPTTDSTARELAANVVTPLIAWIVAKTGWTVHEAPLIRFIPEAELVKMFTGGKETDFHIHALYADKEHSIYLPDGWRADDLYDRSALLHELVHHLQNLNNVKAACSSEYELQAFELQAAWLREQGVEDPLNFMGINAMAIFLLSRCTW
jgi:hypothetical protein